MPAHAAELSDTVVKLFVTANKMDYYRPWQSKGITSSSGSGAIVSGNKILTNAHVIADHTFIQVKKNNDPKKYTARVEAIGHDCDLALLKVDDPRFFHGVKPLEFGGLPKLQDAVAVLGYPQGGDKISITEGVVSRVEITSYSQSSRKLLTVQIDAAINAGNSGGPVVLGNKLVGIAMQVFTSGQNIGYMIPVPVINHFFDDLGDGLYDGFPLVGIEYNGTENKSLRSYFGIEKEEGGVLVTKVQPFSPASGMLQENDIIFAVDGVPIGEDGTFEFREEERLAMPHLLTIKQINDSVRLKISREGKTKEIDVTLKAFTPLVPYPQHFDKPPYYIYGGLVFTVLSSDLLQSWGNRWWEKAPIDFTHYLFGIGRMNKDERREVVVLLNVLSDDINVGYHDYHNNIINEVNGKGFSSFKEFVALTDEVKRTKPNTIFVTEKNNQIILDNTGIDKATKNILERNNIPYQYSRDVAGWLGED